MLYYSLYLSFFLIRENDFFLKKKQQYDLIYIKIGEGDRIMT